MAYGLHSNHPIIDVSTVAAFWTEVESRTLDSNGRRLRKSIQKSVVSIQHKLNIIRYNAGLIHYMIEKDYLRLAYRHLYSSVELANIDSTTMYQDRCMYFMQNDAEYRMFLTFFLESFAAASFSLFDVCAHLLDDLFSLELPRPRGVDYAAALRQSKLKDGYGDLHAFLCRYSPGQTDRVDWVKPLNEVRNRTTHRPITDVWRVPRPSEDGNPFDDSIAIQEFVLYEDIFEGACTDKRLKKFVENCFDGIEHFVEELYARLTAEIKASPSLPL